MNEIDSTSGEQLMNSPAEKPDTRPQPHSKTAMFMHWGFLAFFLYALSKQLDEVEELEDTNLLNSEMVFATIFLIVVVGRFLYMQFTRPTALPIETPPKQRLLARAVHLGMYAGVAMIAVTGLIIGALYYAEMKTGFAMEAALLAHEIFVNGTYTLIFVHVAAAVYHRHLGDGIWETMVPAIGKAKSEGNLLRADD